VAFTKKKAREREREGGGQRKIKTRSRKHCFRGKTKRVTYSECVFVFVP